MNTESADCRRVKVPLQESQTVNPGDFAWDFDSDQLGGDRNKPTHYIYVCLPGEHHLSAIEVQHGQPGGPRIWGWDGNEDKPTLTPSILTPDRWHGHMQAGRLVSC